METGLDHERRVRYCEWWKKYVWLGRALWISLLIFVICLFSGDGPLSPVARLLKLPAFGAFMVLLLWHSFLDCPRCGQTFKAWYGGELDYVGDECQHCGLSKREIASIAKRR